jgi:hypothetical protein
VATLSADSQTASGSGAIEAVRMRPALRSPRPPFRAADATDSASAGRSELPASNCLEELALEEDSWLDRRLPNDLKL